MKRIVVMAFEDRTRPEGGHATLLLVGVRLKPERLTFELRLIDAAEAESGVSRIGQELVPAAARLTEEGLEIVAGPEVTELPQLTVGAAVEIVVRSLDVKGELLWPDVMPLARPRRRTRVTRSPVREPQPPQAPQPGLGLDGAAPSSSAPQPGPELPLPIDLTGIAMPSFVEPGPAADGGARSPRAMVTPALPCAADTRYPANGHRRGPTPPVQASPRTVAAPSDEGDGTPPASRPPDFPAPPPHRPPGPPLARSWPGFAGLVIAAVLALQAIAYVALGGDLSRWLGRLPGAASAGPTGATRLPPGPPPPAAELFDLLAPGQRSPAGRDALGITAERALALAAEHLQDGASRRNTPEGAFWLQRYLAERLGDPLVVRALTQLGSAHAEPSAGRPDYVKAHRLWQIAGAYGDPIALCFLAALHSNGLGVPVDRIQANRWLASAMAAGGCGTGGAGSGDGAAARRR